MEQEAADIGEGAGDRSQLVFDDQGRPSPCTRFRCRKKDNRFGLWACASREGRHLECHPAPHGLGPARSPHHRADGEIVVAIYSASIRR
jgi:hypothetical protein